MLACCALPVWANAASPGTTVPPASPIPGTDPGFGPGNFFHSELSAAIPLIPDESTHNFFKSKPPITIRPGVVSIIALVPPGANARHGVGLDGGPYRSVQGASVLPGRTSSLTVSLKRGKYTLFDSFENNRAHGYSARLKVSAKAPKFKRSGHRCNTYYGFGGILNDVRVIRSSCRLANTIGQTAFEYWQDADFRVSSVSTRGYTCTIITHSRIGLRVVCRQGAKQMRFTV